MATNFANFFFRSAFLKELVFSSSFTRLLSSPIRDNITSSSLSPLSHPQPTPLRPTAKLGEKCHLSEVYHTHVVSDTSKTKQSDQELLSVTRTSLWWKSSPRCQVPHRLSVCAHAPLAIPHPVSSLFLSHPDFSQSLGKLLLFRFCLCLRQDVLTQI